MPGNYIDDDDDDEIPENPICKNCAVKEKKKKTIIKLWSQQYEQNCWTVLVKYF